MWELKNKFLTLLLAVFILLAGSGIGSAAENLTVHFIDVGQGDSILLEYGDSDMLIDAGERSASDNVADYLNSEGITSLDYVVATHPHADHIGGISDILKTFPVGQFIDSGYPHTSGTYEYMLETINRQNIPFKTVKRGDQIDFASGISVEVLNPGSTYFDDDLNQNSVVLKIIDGQVSFLLMGDAGKEAENAIMEDGYDVNADILKVGHHGSRTASGSTFISAVSPDVSVIEVGEGNEYGHPHEETLETLQKVSTVYRTDIDGTVTITTDGSIYSVTTENTVPVTPPVAVLPIADFSTSITEGTAPLEVKFTDLSQNAVSWNWDFDNNGQSDSTVQNPSYVYETPGDYTVTLTVSNADGTDSETRKIKVLEAKKEGLPVANFEANVTSGYAPLSVLFTDRSQDATQIGWDFNEDGGADASTSPIVYTYTSPGTYKVTLTATNKNGTASKTITIDVNREHNRGSSSGSSGGSGGGGGGSPEPAKNVEVKELSQVFITNGKAVQFDFTKNATCVVYVGFDSIRNAGKTTTIAEQLKDKSVLVPKLPEGEVYKSFNVWVGNSGYATPKNIEKPVLCFKVEKTWLQNENVDQKSITLNRYEDKDKHDGKDSTWTQLPASLIGEDDNYLYFTSEVPGYSFFAITGERGAQSVQSTEPTATYKGSDSDDGEGAAVTEESAENTESPGFGLISGIVCLFCMFMCRIKNK